MITTRLLNNAIHTELKPHGFQRKGSNWYLSSEQVIVVLNLQRSQYSATYFLNLGFWLQQIEHIDFPGEHQCHIRTRASSLWPEGTHRPEEGPPRIADLLSIDDYPCNEGQRLERIRQFVAEKLVPTLKAGVSVEGLKQLLEEQDGFLIMLVARDTLGLPLPD
ncbi:DUF4304 domain-containing protein [uncultured Gimesia sp.]|uniref:DUF4304 domain-containing protein n=1 Tax=uncultured Gimesia sp. TaxID=1678688 RepID=UPI0030D7D093|tara:strand:+ start:34142 stop:34630 length:489 start_codon:yes stop_codon:yes gene_type:complete